MNIGTGDGNTALGFEALEANMGSNNIAVGVNALAFFTAASDNTVIGNGALGGVYAGSHNIALGHGAGAGSFGGSHNIWIGNDGAPVDVNTIRIGNATDHSTTFIAGIHGESTSDDADMMVMISADGKLGTVTSSRRFKKEIEEMGDASSKLLELQPVTFKYKQEPVEGTQPLQYGLIAEEVAEVFPDLVVYDDERKPFTVKYHLLSSMLLNELQKQERKIQRLEARDQECLSRGNRSS